LFAGKVFVMFQRLRRFCRPLSCALRTPLLLARST
jgi:hypothetical protein